MKITLSIAAICIILIGLISLQIINSLPKPRSPAVVVPYCVSETLGYPNGRAFYVPCAEVDRYEYT